MNITEKIERVLNNMLALTDEFHTIAKDADPRAVKTVRDTVNMLHNKITKIQKELENTDTEIRSIH